MEINTFITSLISNAVTTVIVMTGLYMISIRLASVFKADVQAVIARSSSVEASSSGIKVEMNQEIEAATKNAAVVNSQNPIAEVTVHRDKELEVKQSRIDEDEALRTVVLAWIPLEQAVKVLSELHFRDYSAAHGTISGIGRLRHSHIATEAEYQSVSRLRNIVYNLSRPNRVRSLPIGKANIVGVTALATAKALQDRIDQFRNNGGEARYQELIADQYPKSVVQLRRR